MRKFLLSLITLSLLLSIVSLGVSATSMSHPAFRPEDTYTVLTPTSEQLVYIKETEARGLNHQSSQYGQLLQTAAELSSLKEWLLPHEGFNVDSKEEGLPSLREQLTNYEDSFFEHNALLWLAYEGWYDTKELIPTPPPILDALYLQDNVIHVADRTASVTDRQDEIPSFEYHFFIHLKKDALPRNMAFDSVSYIRYESPNTADPILSFTALAVASTALLAAGVSLGRRRRRDNRKEEAICSDI